MRGQTTTTPMAQVGTPTPRDTGPSAEERLAALVEREEQRGEQQRLRRALWVGVVGWSMYVPNDLFLYFHERTLVAHDDAIFIRPIIGAIGLACAIALHREGWSRRALRATEVGLFTLGGVGLGLLAVRGSEDLRSVHVIAVLLIVLVHAVTIGSTWKRAILPIGGAALAPLVVLAIGGFFSEKLAVQWGDASAVMVFLQQYTMVPGGVLLTLVGGQVVADLRRQVAEARSIGRYRLRKRIASGGMGEVWSAYHAGLRRDVAVKIMRRERSDARSVARFEREVRATAELTHPNTVRVLDYGVTADGLWYYAMELLEGETLQAIVDREGSLPPERALRLITQAAQALAEAHQRGIVHRDVKPPNLFVIQSAGEEYAKVIDFGIARVADELEVDLTRTGMVVGTPGYIAPEVLGGAPATPRSDVYSLGVVLYFAIAGHGPFAADSPAALLTRIATETAPPLDAPPELARIVARCLEREPSARYASAEDLAHALRDCEL